MEYCQEHMNISQDNIAHVVQRTYVFFHKNKPEFPRRNYVTFVCYTHTHTEIKLHYTSNCIIVLNGQNISPVDFTTRM